MTPPTPDSDAPLPDGSVERSAAADTPEPGSTPVPLSRLTAVTRFAVRGLAEGALGGSVTGVLTGLVALVLPVGFAVVVGDQTPDVLAGWLYVTVL